MLFRECLFFSYLEYYSIYIDELDGTSVVPDPKMKSKSRAFTVQLNKLVDKSVQMRLK